jgi:hypothetical protein
MFKKQLLLRREDIVKDLAEKHFQKWKDEQKARIMADFEAGLQKALDEPQAHVVLNRHLDEYEVPDFVRSGALKKQGDSRRNWAVFASIPAIALLLEAVVFPDMFLGGEPDTFIRIVFFGFGGFFGYAALLLFRDYFATRA